MKKTFRILISFVLVFCLSISAFAVSENTDAEALTVANSSFEAENASENSENQIQPRGKYTYIKNKVFQSRTGHEFLQYVFEDRYGVTQWAAVSEYTLGIEKTYSASGSIEAGSIKFRDAAKIAIGFTGSYSQSFSADLHFTADPNRYSNIAVTATYNISTCDVYETEYTQEEVLYDTYIGSGTIKEPYRIYLTVCYEGKENWD